MSWAATKSASVTSAGWPVQAPREDPPHLLGGGGVEVQLLSLAAPAGVAGCRMRAGVDEAVPVRRPAAQIAALVAGLDPHRFGGAVSCSLDFPFRAGAEFDEDRPVGRVVEVDRAERFR